MDFVETEGDTIDQAIENALKSLGVAREKITVDILSEGKKGLFGFGAGLAVGLQFPAAAQALEQAGREECHWRAASRARRGMSEREMPRSASSRLVRYSSSWTVREYRFQVE